MCHKAHSASARNLHTCESLQYLSEKRGKEPFTEKQEVGERKGHTELGEISTMERAQMSLS